MTSRFPTANYLALHMGTLASVALVAVYAFVATVWVML
jgi:hypothetical protein